MILILLLAGALASLVVAGLIAVFTKAGWVRFGTIASILFFGGWAVAYVGYRNSAKEAFREFSPDGRYYVVVYRLPNFSWTPGSSSDAPAMVRLFDAAGRLKHQGDVPMLQMAEVNWSDEEVGISGHVWSLK